MTVSSLRVRDKGMWKLPQGTHHIAVTGETLDGGALIGTLRSGGRGPEKSWSSGEAEFLREQSQDPGKTRRKRRVAHQWA